MTEGTTQGAADAAPPKAQVRRQTLLICAFFILSGSCGLAYEVLWTRYLGLFLGNTVLLHMAVLGAFMGGLAGGSFLLGSRADRASAPLGLYGWLELAIAGYAIVFPSIAGAAQGWVVEASRAMPAGSLGLLAFKVLLAGALLVVPTLLMGATFPALTAHLQRSVAAGTTGANWLYFANCAGAVAGTLITGFFLIPELGLKGTAMAVAILNIAVGGAAVLASRSGQTKRRTAPAAPAGKPTAIGSPHRKLVLFAICASGATAFIYEMVWTRIFAVTLGSSTYSFTLMLAAFITGLALGSVAANLIRNIKHEPLAWFAGAEVFIGLTVALSLAMYERIPFWFWQWKWLLRPVPQTFGWYLLLQYGLTFLVMAGPTFLFGLTFPTAIRAASSSDEADVAAESAAVYGWNTVGTLFGVVLAGVVLIPLVGLRATLQVAAVLNLLIGGALVLKAPACVNTRRTLAVAAAVTVVTLVVSPRWHPVSLSYGAFRNQQEPPASWESYSKRLLVDKLLFYREDFGSTVAVLRHEDTKEPSSVRLVVDGKADATSYGDMPTQLLLAQVPLFLRPHAKDVFVLGLGSGVTIGSALTHPVERVDAVELTRAVVDGAEQFTEFNRGALKDPRLHLSVDDGKTVLAAAPRQYDVIISEPTNPWISGVGNLFSEEFFRTAERKLKPDGILTQWFHAYELNDQLVATIIRTFKGVFPHVVIFAGSANDFVMIGSKQPLTAGFPAMEERMRRPEVASDLQRIGIHNVLELLARQSHSPAGVDEVIQKDGEPLGGVNTDDLPLLEFLAPRALYVRTSAERIKQTDSRLSAGQGLLVEAYLREHPLTREGYQSLIESLSDSRLEQNGLSYRLLRAYLSRWRDDPKYLRRLAEIMVNSGWPREGLSYARRAGEPTDPADKTQLSNLEKRAVGDLTTVFSAP